LCVASFRGGVKSEEFTVTKNGFHYHLHCIFLSKWLLFNEVRRTWTDCVRQAFAEHERPFEVKTSDGMLIIKIKQITPTEASIQEVCKYITKSDSWGKLRSTDFLDIALIPRWFRMFELMGSFAEDSEAVCDASEPIVHTRSLTDGGFEPSPRYWRIIIKIRRPEYYLRDLQEKIERCRGAGLTEMYAKNPGKVILTFDKIVGTDFSRN